MYKELSREELVSSKFVAKILYAAYQLGGGIASTLGTQHQIDVMPLNPHRSLSYMKYSHDDHFFYSWRITEYAIDFYTGFDARGMYITVWIYDNSPRFSHVKDCQLIEGGRVKQRIEYLNSPEFIHLSTQDTIQRFVKVLEHNLGLFRS